MISLGGSVMVPDEIDFFFLRGFYSLILRWVSRYQKIILVVGGGKICRRYQSAAKALARVIPRDLDWIGIQATKLNAELLRALFGRRTHPAIIDDPYQKIRTSRKILIASGSLPGFSSDFDAVVLAKRFGAKIVINLSNIPGVYSKDPRTNHDRKTLDEISWRSYRRMVGNRFDPGMNLPFDPIASQEAEKHGISVVVLDGRNLSNLTRCLRGQSFQGTVIR